MNLLISLRAELLKTKRTPALYFTGLAALLIPLVFFIDVCTDGMEKENSLDPLNAFFREGAKGMGVFILPLFVILLCTLLAQIEYRNNTWKQLFASPQTGMQVYSAKFLNMQLLLLLFLLLYNGLMLLALAALRVTVPVLELGKYRLDWGSLLHINLNLYASVLAISSIQFWISIRFRNFVVSAGVGIVLWLAACFILLELHFTYANLYPYTLPVMSVFERYQPKLSSIQLTSVAYAVVFLLLGCLDFSRRSIR
ncbi:MAG: ABC transporter permease [Williamsia sp.]|nr:ABC transporter permease [Williamsia sp.]